MFHVPRAQQELGLGKARDCTRLAIHSDENTLQRLIELPGATRNTAIAWRQRRHHINAE